MKNWKLIIGIMATITLMWCHSVHAQETQTDSTENSVFYTRLLARSYGDSIVLRWAPEKSSIWMLSNYYGWNIACYKNENEDDTLSSPYLNAKPIRPYTLEEFQQHFDSTNLMAGVAAQALYGQNPNGVVEPRNGQGFENYIFRKNQEQEQRQFFAYLASETSPDIANALGLRFVDKNVKKGELYEYSISSLIPEKYATVPDVTIIVECKPFERTEEELVAPIEIMQIDPYRAVVYWKKNKLSGYYIERSSNKGKSWKKMNEAPIYGMDPNPGTASVYGEEVEKLMNEYVVFVDSLGLDTTYQYRIKGFDAFSDYAPARTSDPFEMEDLIPPFPPSLHSIFPEKNQICRLVWDKPIMEKDVKCFVVTFADNWDGPWENVSGPLSPKTFTYTDNEAGQRGRGYYRVFVSDESGNVAYSEMVINNIEDVTPPAQPYGLRAMVDTTGIMYMEWNPNREKDLRGYKVYFANQLDHDFIEASKGFLYASYFLDTVDITMLTPHIYYYVVACDNSYNYSKHSDTLEVKFPDLNPPAIVLLEDFRVDNGAVTARWRRSVSDDVANYFIFRKPEGHKHWECIYIATPDDVEDGLLTFRDYPTPSSTPYNYCIEALDYSQKSSGKNGEFTVQVKGPSTIDVKINLKAACDKKTKRATLTWDYQYTSDREHYGVIYRSIDGGEYRDIATFKRGETTFTDYKVKEGEKVSYYIQLVLGKGKKSTPSNVANVSIK